MEKYIKQLESMSVHTPFTIEYVEYDGPCVLNPVHFVDSNETECHVSLLVEIIKQYADWNVSSQCLFEYQGVDYISYMIPLIEECRNHLSMISHFDKKYLFTVDELWISFAKVGD